MTFAATAELRFVSGCDSGFADVSGDTLNLDPEQVARENLAKDAGDSSGGLRRASGGDLNAILEIARKHGLIVIEDACHALGAEYRGRRVGSIADMTVFSFHPVKHITTGEGGMVTTEQSASLPRRCGASAITGFPATRASGRVRGNGTMRWFCWDSIIGCPIIVCALGFSNLRGWMRIWRGGGRSRRNIRPRSAKFRA